MKKSAPAANSALGAETAGAETSGAGGRKVVLAMDSKADVTEEVNVMDEEMDEIVDQFGEKEVYPSHSTPMIKSILAKRRKTAPPLADPAGEASSEAVEDMLPDASGGAGPSGSSSDSNAPSASSKPVAPEAK